MNRTKNAVRNIVTGFINKFVMLFFPFIIRTILIKKLGAEYLGLNSLFVSILQVLNLTELGFSSAIIFSMYKPIADGDKKTICGLLNFYKKIYRCIGLVLLIIGLLLLPFLTSLIHGTYPNDINIYILYLIYLVNTVITYFLFAYKSALITAHQRNDLINNVSTFVLILQYLIQIIVLLILKNYYLYIIVNTFSNILNNLLVAYIAKKRYPDYVCDGSISVEEKKEIKKRVFGLIVQKICATTRNSLDSIYISAFFGLNVVAIYGNYYYIMNSVTGILAIIVSSMTASVGNSIVTESKQKNYNDMNKFNFLYMWISGWCTICLLCLYQPFVKLWVGENFMFPISVVFCFCAYFYTLKMGDILSVYYTGAGLWYEGRIRAVLESILNIVLNYILGKKFGIVGIILATEISLFSMNFLYGSQIIFKHYFKNKKLLEYYKYNFIYCIVTIIGMVFTYKICLLFDLGDILTIIVRGIICIIVPNIIYYIFYFKLKSFKESKQFIKNNILNKRSV